MLNRSGASKGICVLTVRTCDNITNIGNICHVWLSYWFWDNKIILDWADLTLVPVEETWSIGLLSEGGQRGHSRGNGGGLIVWKQTRELFSRKPKRDVALLIPLFGL